MEETDEEHAEEDEHTEEHDEEDAEQEEQEEQEGEMRKPTLQERQAKLKELRLRMVSHDFCHLTDIIERFDGRQPQRPRRGPPEVEGHR